MASENSRRRWSAKVTETSDALDLEEGIFNARSARRIAASLDFCEVYPQWRNDGLRRAASDEKVEFAARYFTSVWPNCDQCRTFLPRVGNSDNPIPDRT